MKQPLILFLLFQVTIAFSQQKVADSLLQKFNNCKVDSTKIDILLTNATFFRDTKPEEAIFYGKAALKIAQNDNDIKRESLLLDLIAQGCEQTGNIADAISYYNESYKTATEIHDIEALAKVKLNLGACYTDIGNYHLAVEYYKSALNYFTSLQDNLGICKSEVYLSDALFKFNDPDKSLYYLEKAKPISIKNKSYLLDYIYTNFAECYYQKKELALAKENAEKGKVISEKLNDLYGLSAEYLVLAKVYLALNDLKNAEIFVKKGFDIATQTNIKENLIDSYNTFSKVREKQKKYAEALKFMSLYISTKDSVQSSLNNNIIQAYDYEKKNEEIAVMKADAIEKGSELKTQHYVTAVIFATLLLLICITGYIFYSSNKLIKANLEIKKAYREINRKQTEIMQQNQELIWNNEKILKQSERIEELNNLKDRLFSIISHDLRSPLNNLRGILNLSIAGNLSHDKFRTLIPQLTKAVGTTSDLLENLLYWSTSQLKGQLVVCNDLDINLLAQKQLNLFEKQALDKEIILKNEIPTNTIVFADKNMIDVVLRNLVANAIKFCYRNGKIIISSKKYDDHIEISVKDKGMGILPQNMPRLFQVKERFTTMDTNNKVGTGLGLLLCKDFVEKNNGIIGVESKLNEGSCFWFTLPKGKKESS